MSDATPKFCARSFTPLLSGEPAIEGAAIGSGVKFLGGAPASRGGVESSDTHLEKNGLIDCRLGLESPVAAVRHTAGVAPGPRDTFAEAA